MTDSHVFPEVDAAPDAGSVPPVFLVGCGRSGTTLLRLMLHAHPEITIPQESHVIYKIARERAMGRWPGDLTAPRAWEGLVDHLMTTRDLDPWHFDRGPLRDRLGALDERSHAAAFRVLFEAYLAQHGGLRWGDKTPQHVQYMLILDRLFPGAQFVHVTRDGRDVAMSLLRMKSWGPKRMAEAGYYWAWLVLSGIVAGYALGPTRYYQLRYENLVSDTEATLRPLVRWLGHDYCDEMLTYYASDDAERYAAQAHAGAEPPLRKHPATTPPDPGQLQKWRTKMDAADRRSIHRQAGGLLAHLGYEVDNLPRAQQAFRHRLEALLEPSVIPALARDVRPVGGPEAVRPARLLGVRAGQLAALLAGRPEAFARGSLRWQTTVAGLLP